MKKKDSNKNENWEKLFGSWKDKDMPAKNMAKFIRDSRFSNRKIESFDKSIKTKKK